MSVIVCAFRNFRNSQTKEKLKGYMKETKQTTHILAILTRLCPENYSQVAVATTGNAAKQKTHSFTFAARPVTRSEKSKGEGACV